MADIKMPKVPEHKPCCFQIAWRGQCNKPTDNGWCTGHEKEKCVVCGAQATHSCDYTGSGPLVCEASLCATCKHEPYIQGSVDFPSKHLNAAEFAEAETRASAAELISR